VKSLKSRLLIVLSCIALLFWGGTVAWWILHSTRTETGYWDIMFQTVAGQILISVPKEIEQLPEPKIDPKIARAAEKLSFQVWVNKQRAVIRSPGSPTTPLKPDFVDGFADESKAGQSWRVYSIADEAGKLHVQVGAMHSVMGREFVKKALAVLLISLFLLALLGTAIWWVVCWSLKPVVQIEAALREKKVFDLTPLPADDLPHEIKPLVVSFNSLLHQLDEAVEDERRFIADAAHELRTPLAALQAHVQVALKADTAAEKNEALVKLLAVIERSGRLSEQLLDLARLDAGKRAGDRVTVDLCELIPVVVRDFESQAGQKRQTIAVETSPCSIVGDIDELGILLRNLVDNALRYTQEEGRVAITCGCVERDGKQHCFLSVADNGPGVPEEAQRHIFDRFYRVPGNGGRGSGIGLSLVARIAEIHGAKIELKEGLVSREGWGLGVTILFPAA
jgi:signal transduction histidine kinase